jgi:hypothetical protein
MASTRYHEELDWLSMFDDVDRIRWDALDLNRQAAPLRKADGFNVAARHQPLLWQWSKADAATLRWRPQGITGSREAGHPRGPRWLAVSWYGRTEANNAHQGARISLIDCDRDSATYLEYRHVLLVQDAKNIDDAELFRLPGGARYQQLAGFAPVPVHAGGIAWVGDLLYVADTTLGLRVFDLTRIHAAHADPTRSRCGRKGERLYGFDHRYVLPQVGYYRMDGVRPVSFVSVAAGASGRTLWTGQYLTKSEKRVPRLFGWPLRSDGHIDTRRAAVERTPDDSGRRASNMQGACRAKGATWLSVTGRSTHQRSTARLIGQQPGRKGVRWRWPHGAEDLYFEAETGTLWCLTEYAAGESSGERVVFGVRLSTYRR